MKHPQSPLSRIPIIYWVVGALFALLAGGIAYGGYEGHQRLTALEAENQKLRGQIASTTDLMRESITEIEHALSGELAKERERLSSLQNRLGDFQNEVGTISGNVSNLEKLTKTDEELLQKYSRVFFLSENYAPSDVTEIPDEYKYSTQRPRTIHTDVYPYLKDMLDAAAEDDKEIYVFSAYRPFEEQSALNNHYEVTYGQGTANQFSADQGYSEHQLGTTVDLITTGIGGSLREFEKTDDYAWLVDNAHRFGFTLSYPEGNSQYIFEPWHWRFVGVKLATDLYNSDQYLYDLTQREIDEYLIHLFE